MAVLLDKRANNGIIPLGKNFDSRCRNRKVALRRGFFGIHTVYIIRDHITSLIHWQLPLITYLRPLVAIGSHWQLPLITIVIADT
jgi:hypothetical protein